MTDFTLSHWHDQYDGAGAHVDAFPVNVHIPCQRADPGRQQQQQQQAAMQPQSSHAGVGASAAVSMQPGLSPMPWLPQGLAPPWPSPAGMQGAPWQLPPASLAQLAAALAANASGHLALGQQMQYDPALAPPLGQQILTEPASANGMLSAGIGPGGMHGPQPAFGLLPNMCGAVASAMLQTSPHSVGTSMPLSAPDPVGQGASAALQPALMAEQLPALLGMSMPAPQQALATGKQQAASAPVNGRTHLAGS